ncbi:AAA ATPase-like protein [Deinococcus yavapaiensis KR-236]|uniref:AAA ATPase-like protein n=1 Tax=Deinococcus yavapaiensis KR-236 TaxID=694435 RepID=A0A318S392_9DEIO|nr:AAA ATPase-like protein [Deinococcus yavapaiensis KR-236]
MLKSIELEKFKSIRTTQRVEFKPLTLLFGPNSAGKSSVIQALLLLKRAFEVGDFNPGVIRHQAQEVDLGGLLSFIHGRVPSRTCRLKFTVEATDDRSEDRPGTSRRKRTLTWDMELGLDRDEQQDPRLAQDPNRRLDQGGIRRCRIYEDNTYLLTLEAAEVADVQGRSFPRALALTHLNTDAPQLRRLVHSALRSEFKEASTNPEILQISRSRYDMAGRELNAAVLTALRTDFAIPEAALLTGVLGRAAPRGLHVEHNPGTRRWQAVEDVGDRSHRYLPSLASHSSAFREVFAEFETSTTPRQLRLPAGDVGRRLLDHLARPLHNPDREQLAKDQHAYFLASHYLENQRRLVEEVLPLFVRFVDTLAVDTARALEGFRYLGPLRRLPDRRLGREQSSRQDGDVWSTLVKDGNIRERVNRWLGPHGLNTSYRFVDRRLFDQRSVRRRQHLAYEDGLTQGVSWLTKALRTELPLQGIPLEAFEHALEQVRRRVLEAHLASLEEFPDAEEHSKVEDVDLDAESEAIDFANSRTAELGQLRLSWWAAEHSASLADLSAEKFYADRPNAYDEFTSPASAELVLFDVRHDVAVSVRDVGTGISQVVPVLVYAEAEDEKLVAIEQPELHLHPALQAELADTFIASAKRNRSVFLLETHSEHLMLRILRRIRETTEGEEPSEELRIGPQDVLVLFGEPSSQGSTFREVPLTVNGEFEGHWPKGFFADRSKELM